jgi:hypothetical protein
VVKDEVIYARGSADDKGQFYMHVKAVEAMLKTNGLPCNVKFMIEGEEEVGSDNLGAFVAANKKKLAADVVLISDTAMIANDIPSINTGLRGLSYVEVEVTGPNRDLHSGVYGGAVANPINTLCAMIASLHDAEGRVNIPGFYDDVRELTAGERKALAEAPFDEKAWMKDLGVNAVKGEKGIHQRRALHHPPDARCERHLGRLHGRGVQDGAARQGFRQDQHAPGARPEQRPDHEALHRALPEDRATLRDRQGATTPRRRAGRDPHGQRCLQGREQGDGRGFREKPIPTRGGGSIPIVALFEKELG